MDSKVCVVCNIEKIIDNFYNKYRECKACNILRSTRRYYENKEEKSNQHKIYYEKNRDVLLAKSKINQQKKTMKEKYINNKYKNLIKSYKI